MVGGIELVTIFVICSCAVRCLRAVFNSVQQHFISSGRTRFGRFSDVVMAKAHLLGQVRVA